MKDAHDIALVPHLTQGADGDTAANITSNSMVTGAPATSAGGTTDTVKIGGSLAWKMQ